MVISGSGGSGNYYYHSMESTLLYSVKFEEKTTTTLDLDTYYCVDYLEVLDYHIYPPGTGTPRASGTVTSDLTDNQVLRIFTTATTGQTFEYKVPTRIKKPVNKIKFTLSPFNDKAALPKATFVLRIWPVTNVNDRRQ